MKVGKLLLFLLFASINTMAQPGPPPPDPGEPVPIQGIAFLLLAGAFLGVKKLIDKKNKH